jgi:ribosome-associated protein YbcJ (S4-like RNA binding protein)
MPLTSEDVIEIVGPLDDLKIAEIIASGANLTQITAAKMMLADGEVVGTVLGHEDEPETRRVYEILQSEEPEPEER